MGRPTKEKRELLQRARVGVEKIGMQLDLECGYTRLMLGVISRAAYDMATEGSEEGDYSAGAQRFLQDCFVADLIGLERDWIYRVFKQLGVIE